MGHFLDAATKILSSAGQPLTAREIVDRAIADGVLLSSGHTPWQTMKSKLSTDILRKGARSRFMRSRQGEFALRAWRDRLEEHVADRYQKALFDEDIMVFPACSLHRYLPTSGLHRVQAPELANELVPMRRRDAEQDTSVIQLVSVFVVRFGNTILTHKRTKRLPESRLHGFYSLNFGGHLNPDDVTPLFNIFIPSQGRPWLMRELSEELRIGAGRVSRIEYHGLLYDDSREVSRQHLGLVYEVHLNEPVLDIGERGFLIDAKYEAPQDIWHRIAAFENWSVILLQELEPVCR